MITIQQLKSKGFSIVELLVIITVIGILSTIGIVSYNGIQQQARNTQTITAVKQWADAIAQYEADNKVYPPLNNAFGVACLGQDYPFGLNGEGSSGGQCGELSGLDILESPSEFIDPLRGYFDGGLPTPDFQTVQNESGNFWMRGAIAQQYGSTDTTGYYILFVLKGVDSCPKIGNVASRAYGDDSDIIDQLSPPAIENGLLCAVIVT